MIDDRDDAAKGIHHHQEPDTRPFAKQKNFDQKIYMFPESYNQLRKELHDYWPNLWAGVSWPMAFAANMFVERMNEALDMTIQFDSGKVDFICESFLVKLQDLRKKQIGLAELQLISEKSRLRAELGDAVDAAAAVPTLRTMLQGYMDVPGQTLYRDDAGDADDSDDNSSSE